MHFEPNTVKLQNQPTQLIKAGSYSFSWQLNVNKNPVPFNVRKSQPIDKDRQLFFYNSQETAAFDKLRPGEDALKRKRP